MTMTWDLTDVPAVETADLAAAMRALIDDERGLVLLRGLADGDLDTVQAELQRRFHGEPQRALAVFVRFRHLVEVFSARRLKDMMLDRGYALMAPAIADCGLAAPQRQPRLQPAAVRDVAAVRRSPRTSSPLEFRHGDATRSCIAVTRGLGRLKPAVRGPAARFTYVS